MKFPPHPLTSAEARALVAAAGSGWRGARNSALLVTLWRCGLRAAEACALDLQDVEPDETVEAGAFRVFIAQPKGANPSKRADGRRVKAKPPRHLGLDPHGGAVLVRWIQKRGDAPGPLFPSRTGRRLQTSSLRQLLPMLGRRAGIARRVHAHALRHTYARELYDEGVGVREIQVLLGHGSLNTTEIYLKSIGADRAIKTTMRRKWK